MDQFQAQSLKTGCSKMKLQVILVHLVVMVKGDQTHMQTQNYNSLYTIECMSEGFGAVHLHNDSYLLVGREGCTPVGPAVDYLTKKPTGSFHLGPNCIPNKTLIVLPKTEPMLEDMHAFQVECASDGIDATIKGIYNISIRDLLSSPIQETHAIPGPIPDVSLHILKQKPKTTRPGEDATAVNLGETVFLTLADNINTDLLLPQSCSARKETESVKDTKVLWQLGGNRCIWEPSIVKSPMTIDNVEGKPYTYLQLEAFKLSDEDSARITFSCSVRVCSDVDSGACQSDKKKLDACNSGHHPSPRLHTRIHRGQRRRRRQFDNSTVRHGRLHHLTATLEVVVDVHAAEKNH